MKHRMSFLAGAAIGYVLGARAGRERYEQIRQTARKIIENPQVQEAADGVWAQANDLAAKAMDKGKELAGTAKTKAETVTGAAKDKVGLPHRSQGTPGAHDAVRTQSAQDLAGDRSGQPNRTTTPTHP